MRLDKLQEFRATVFEQLTLWEYKTNDLCSLATKYHGYLDEQTANFNKLKVFLGEKDALIADLHQQI